MDRERLYKYASNQMEDLSEIEEVVSWIESSAEHKEEFETIKNLIAITGFANYDTYVDEQNESSGKKGRRRIIYRQFIRYAAVFVFAFLSSGLLLMLVGKSDRETIALNQIIVPDGESAELYLSDNTHVWLNSGSKLEYPARFKGKARNVRLEGEAYFEVTHNSKRPFYVNSEYLKVQVVGTSFNVESYENSGVVNVTLVEGKVILRDIQDKLITGLIPGKNASYDVDERKMKISNVETSFFTSWKDGYLIFKDDRLIDITDKLERWFNVEVVYQQESIKDIRFSGTILKNKPIDQILDILKYTSKIEYTIEMRTNKPSIIYLNKE